MADGFPLTNHRASFAFYCCTRIGSTLASQMVSVAVGWQIYVLTNSPIAIGLIGLVQFVPNVSLVLIAGHVADQHDRRKIASTFQMIEGVMTFGIVMAILLHRLDAAVLYGLVFVIAVCRAFESPAQVSLLANIVPRDVLPRAMANSTSSMRVAQLLGPALGGIIFSFSPLACYATACAMVFIAAICIRMTRPAQQAIRRQPMTLGTLFSGVRFVRDDKVILGAISLDLFAVLMGGVTALLPIYARDILQTGAWGLGLLRAAPGAGAVLVMLFLARHPLKRFVGPTLFVSVAAFGLCQISFALSHLFLLSLLMLAISGLFDGISQVIRHTLVQLETPDEVRGRVSAVNFVFTNSSGQLNQIQSGFVAALLGAVGAAVVGGIGSVVVAMGWMAMFPQITRINSFDDLRHPASEIAAPEPLPVAGGAEAEPQRSRA